uniref:Uncharacterized protein n=1 Tax=Knipowitschia caucasica TaxID=637954 RepID=A0AAV2JE89_KNICA
MNSPTGSYLDEEASASMESLPIEELEDEDEDLYYIPERRPSLDLGQSPGETGVLVHVEQPKSPVVSYTSMSSEGISSSINSSEDDRSNTTVHLQRTDSFSSCYSVDSDDCEIRTLKVKQGDGADDDTDENLISTFSKNTNEISHSSLTIPFVFKAICKVLQKLKPQGFDAFRKSLWQHYPQSFNTAPQTMDIVNVVDRLLECYGLQSLQITKTRLRDLELRRLVDFLDDLELQNEVQYELRQRLKMMYGAVECSQGDEKPLDEVFIDLHIKSVHDNGPNIEHEICAKPYSTRRAHRRNYPKELPTGTQGFY